MALVIPVFSSSLHFQINGFMDTLVQENPGFVSKLVIGQSYEGRPLNILKVSHMKNTTINTASNKSILYLIYFYLFIFCYLI